MKGIIVNGEGGVGKDTFVDFCIAELERLGLKGGKASSVDLVKVAARYLGWDGEKDEKGRQFLHDLKMLSTKYCDGPMKYMSGFLEHSQHVPGCTFFHVREPLEITKFVNRFPDTFTIKITRKAVEGKYSNPADGGVHDYDYDMIIVNDNTVAALEQGAKDFVAFIMGEGNGSATTGH